MVSHSRLRLYKPLSFIQLVDSWSSVEVSMKIALVVLANDEEREIPLLLCRFSRTSR